MAPVILAIDTSSSYCSVAVQRSSGDAVCRTSEGDGNHFEQLPGIVSVLLSEAQITFEELQGIRIGVGPGSFTGIRIGMSFAKGLAWSLGVPLYGLSSFWACAAALANRDLIAGSNGRFGVISDARRGELFFGAYAMRGARLEVAEEPRLLPAAEVMAMASEFFRFVTPEKAFSLDGVSPVVEPEIAHGLLLLPIPTDQVSAAQIASVEPSYIREVAAKTIAERVQAGLLAKGG